MASSENKLKNHKEIENYEKSDEYIIISKFTPTVYGKWSIAKKPFNPANVYQAIALKDRLVIEAYLNNNDTPIEVISHDGDWIFLEEDFIFSYNEKDTYRLKE